MNNNNINSNRSFIFTSTPIAPPPKSYFQKIKGGISDKVNRVVSRMAQRLTYPGAGTKFKNPERLGKAEDELTAIGGENLVLNTPDGEKLEAMYFDVNKVAEALGGEEKIQVYQSWHPFAQRFSRFIDVPDENKNKIMRHALDWDHHRTTVTKPLKGWTASVKNFLARMKLCAPSVEKNSFFIFSLGSIEWRNPKENQKENQRPTVILCPGGGCTFQMLKKVLIPAYLKRGINVMAVNYRGYGKSTGLPTERGLNTDIEAAYQYVSQMKNIPNDRIIAHGHCLGSVPAVELAKNHPGIHLVLDRPISDYKLAIKDSFGMALEDLKQRIGNKAPAKLQSCVKNIMGVTGSALIMLAASLSTLIGRFDNESRIKGVKGKVAIIQAKYDETLSPKHAERLTKVIQETEDISLSFMICNKGHSDAWIDEPESAIDSQFDTFLRQAGLLGSLA